MDNLGYFLALVFSVFHWLILFYGFCNWKEFTMEIMTVTEFIFFMSGLFIHAAVIGYCSAELFK